MTRPIQRASDVDSRAMTFTWDVFVPGEDLPRRLITSYLLSEGEEVTVDGRAWLVGNVALIEPIDDVGDPLDAATGTVTVLPVRDPGPH